jgi:glyoxylase-like metal-dependent hydrolase (beta-lactamase superfamily II)
MNLSRAIAAPFAHACVESNRPPLGEPGPPGGRPGVPRRVAFALLLMFGLNACVHAENPADDELRTTKAGGSVAQIDAVGGFGGGNVAVSVGGDGILLVDTMTKGIAPKLRAELSRLSPAPVRLVVNTHFHGDHAGGNLVLGSSAVIVAHEAVRKRLQALHMPNEGLPKVTYRDELTLHFNGEDIRLLHCADAHTDGDTIVVFPQSKVVHFGDLYFNGMFPAVYREGGGNWRGLIACLDRVLPELPEDLTVIAGHGALSNMRELHAYLDMLNETTAIVEEHLRRGETAQQMIQAKVLAKYDALGNGGAQTTEQFVTMLSKLLPPLSPPPQRLDRAARSRSW